MQKEVCFLVNFALIAEFFCIGATVCIGREMLCLQYAGIFCGRFWFPIFLKFMYFVNLLIFLKLFYLKKKLHQMAQTSRQTSKQTDRHG